MCIEEGDRHACVLIYSFGCNHGYIDHERGNYNQDGINLLCEEEKRIRQFLKADYQCLEYHKWAICNELINYLKPRCSKNSKKWDCERVRLYSQAMDHSNDYEKILHECIEGNIQSCVYASDMLDSEVYQIGSIKNDVETRNDTSAQAEHSDDDTTNKDSSDSAEHSNSLNISGKYFVTYNSVQHEETKEYWFINHDQKKISIKASNSIRAREHGGELFAEPLTIENFIINKDSIEITLSEINSELLVTFRTTTYLTLKRDDEINKGAFSGNYRRVLEAEFRNFDGVIDHQNSKESSGTIQLVPFSYSTTSSDHYADPETPQQRNQQNGTWIRGQEEIRRIQEKQRQAQQEHDCQRCQRQVNDCQSRQESMSPLGRLKIAPSCISMEQTCRSICSP